MAVIKHRKLFPAPIFSNQTDCPDCPDCTFECYPYAYFYVPPPPPPPPFPSIDQTDQNHHVSPYVILFLSLLGFLFLLIGYYIIIVMSCTRFCSPNRNNGSPQSESSSEGDEEFAQVDHPIWFITTVGLQPSVINSITICKYRKDEGLIEGTECSVCLNEFHEDEMLRLLPKCSHAFHINCIDTWLRSHTNCPLCRAYIVSETHVNSNVVRPNSSSADENWDGIDRNEDGQMDSSENQSELGVIGTENEGEAHPQQVDDGNPSKDEVVNLDEVPLRRSISMNSFLAKASLVIKFHSVIARNRQSSIEQCLHISPVLMKRSLSCGGRLRLSSFRQKFGMNSVLPL